MLISAIHQHESATGIRMPPPSWTSFPPPSPSHPSRLSQSAEFELPCHIANSHLLSILRMVMYILPCYSLNTEESTSHSIDVTSHCVRWPSSPSWGVLLGFLFPRCQGTFSLLFYTLLLGRKSLFTLGTWGAGCDESPLGRWSIYCINHLEFFCVGKISLLLYLFTGLFL